MVNESVHLNISISQVVMPLLCNHTKVSKPETPQCNTQLLWQVKMLVSTSNLIICGQKSVRQCYCKQRLFKTHVLFLPQIWIHWQDKMQVKILILKQKYEQLIDCNLQLFKVHVYLTLQFYAGMDQTEDPLASSGEEMDSTAPAATKKDLSRTTA